MDFTALVSAIQRTAALSDARNSAAGQRVLLNTRALLPLVNSLAPESELARSLTRMQTSNSPAVFILPAGSRGERLEVGGRQFALPTALANALRAAVDAARNAANAVLAQTETSDAAPSPSTGSAPPASTAGASSNAAPPSLSSHTPANLGWIVGAQTDSARTLSAAGLLRGKREGGVEALAPAATVSATSSAPEKPTAAAAFEHALLDVQQTPDTHSAAQRLRSAVESSGVFYESHLAQWVRNERSDAAMRSEAQRVALHEHAAASTTPAPGERVAAQLDVLQRQTIVMHGPAWHGQPVSIAFARPHDDAGEHGASLSANAQHGGGVFAATLTLHLPSLGTVQAELRLAGQTVAANIGAHDAAQIERIRSALPSLSEALAARGLSAVALSAKPLDEVAA